VPKQLNSSIATQKNFKNLVPSQKNSLNSTHTVFTKRTSGVAPLIKTNVRPDSSTPSKKIPNISNPYNKKFTIDNRLNNELFCESFPQNYNPIHKSMNFNTKNQKKIQGRMGGFYGIIADGHGAKNMCLKKATVILGDEDSQARGPKVADVLKLEIEGNSGAYYTGRPNKVNLHNRVRSGYGSGVGGGRRNSMDQNTGLPVEGKIGKVYLPEPGNPGLSVKNNINQENYESFIDYTILNGFIGLSSEIPIQDREAIMTELEARRNFL
jgi:hypothetical protein